MVAGDLREGATMSIGIRCTTLRVAAAFAAVITIATAVAAPLPPDDARETRWAQEVVPQIVVGEAVWLSTPSRPKVLAIHAPPPGKPKAGVVLVHGLGVHPDFGMIGAVRVELADRGFETLSVQMPVLAADASRDGYRDLYGVAAERIAAGVAWLRATAIPRVVVVSHSLGSAMTDAYLSRAAALLPDGWVAIGMTVDFAATPPVPVADIVAERDFPEALAATKTRAARLPPDRCTRRITVPGADHYFESATGPLLESIVPFLEDIAAGRC